MTRAEHYKEIARKWFRDAEAILPVDVSPHEFLAVFLQEQEEPILKLLEAAVEQVEKDDRIFFEPSWFRPAKKLLMERRCLK